MAMTRAPSLLPAVRFESRESNNGAPLPRNPSPSVPHLSISKPSYIIRTESNVRKVRKKKPDPPCVVCSGSGRVDCFHCNGKDHRQDELHSFSNASERGMAKMVRCRTCGGSGLGYCSRCLGTGEYRYIMGFHFMKRDANDAQDHQNYEVRDN